MRTLLHVGVVVRLPTITRGAVTPSLAMTSMSRGSRPCLMTVQSLSA